MQTGSDNPSDPKVQECLGRLITTFVFRGIPYEIEWNGDQDWYEVEFYPTKGDCQALYIPTGASKRYYDLIVKNTRKSLDNPRI